MTIEAEPGLKKDWEKVVVHTETEVIKGFMETQQVDNLDELLLGALRGIPPFLRVRRLASETVEEIQIEQAKAIFYVKEFAGDSTHKDLHFYNRAPLVHGVWIRIEFTDGELMEGLVHNTMRFLYDPGFFIRPTDPKSNNRLVYVMKKSLRDCRILGLRNL
jgi:hypothetical protein